MIYMITYEEIRENQKRENEKKFLNMIDDISIELKRKDSDIENISIINNFENRKIINIDLSDFEIDIEIRISYDFIDFKIYDNDDILERIFLDLYDNNELKERIIDFLIRMIKLNENIHY